MNKQASLFGVGLFIVAGALTVSCGGSDGGDDSNTSGSSTGGSTAGTNTAGSSTAGTNNNTGGTNSNTGGTNNPTAGSNNNNGGTNNNTGGDDNGPFPEGGDTGFPGFGGEGNFGCPATQPTGECERNFSNRFGCPYDGGAIVCECNGQQGDREWECGEPDQGQGGGNGGFGDVTCPDNAMTDGECTGTGLCPGQPCFCNDGELFCQP